VEENDQRHVRTTGAGLAQPVPGCVAQQPAQVGPAQVLVAVGYACLQEQRLLPQPPQLRRKGGHVPGEMHRVPRLGMGQLELQLRSGWKGVAGPAKGDARLGEAAQGDPLIVHDSPPTSSLTAASSSGEAAPRLRPLRPS